MKDYSQLRCPVCKGRLITGDDLTCSTCRIAYSIRGGIPIMLPDLKSLDSEQDLAMEKGFYENMFSDVKGFDDGHCIVYGHERIYEFCDDIEKGNLLEAGCGGGHHSVALAKRGFNVTAIDLSLNALFAAKKLAEHEARDILFLCGDIKRLPFDDNEFDICFCSLVLHHFLALNNIIKELARVTQKYFIVFEVNALDSISFVRFNLINPVFGIKNISKNQRALFPTKLGNILSEEGFKDINVKYEDVHEYLGKAPNSIKAKIILLYQKIMKAFPEKYSKNKFLLSARK